MGGGRASDLCTLPPERIPWPLHQPAPGGWLLSPAVVRAPGTIAAQTSKRRKAPGSPGLFRARPERFELPTC